MKTSTICVALTAVLMGTVCEKRQSSEMSFPDGPRWIQHGGKKYTVLSVHVNHSTAEEQCRAMSATLLDMEQLPAPQIFEDLNLTSIRKNFWVNGKSVENCDALHSDGRSIKVQKFRCTSFFGALCENTLLTSSKPRKTRSISGVCSALNNETMEKYANSTCYLVSGQCVSKNEALVRCEAWNGSLPISSELTGTQLTLLNIFTGTYWVQESSGINICRVAVPGNVSFGRISCSEKHQYICVRPNSTTSQATTPTQSTTTSTSSKPTTTQTTTTNSTSKPTTTSVSINRREYIAVHLNMSSQNADRYCQSKYSTGQVRFIRTGLYFELLNQLSQVRSSDWNNYWVGGCTDRPDEKTVSRITDCTLVQYGGHGKPEIRLADCLTETHFVCSGPINETDILMDEVFQKMISDMVVRKNGTYRQHRKKISASDRRQSSHAMGCVGIVTLIVITCIIALMDLSGLRTYMRKNSRRRRKRNGK